MLGRILMGKLLRPPGGETTFNALLLFFAGAYGLFQGLPAKPILIAIGVAFMLVGAGLWFRQNWARLAGIVLCVLGLAFFIYRLAFETFSLWNILCLLGVFWILKDLWRERFNQEDEAGGGSLISIVLLLREPRELTMEQVRDMVVRAWGVKLGEDQEANEWMGRMGPSFALVTRFGVYALHVAPEPYMSNPEEAAEDIKDIRLADVISKHRAWYAVDLMRVGEDVPSPEQAYPYIGQLLAELVDDNCLGVYCPESERLNVNSPELVEKLRGPNPLEELTEPLNAPIVQIADDDPRMKAAVDEARRRFPEFLEKFQRRGGDDQFVIKAPIRSGENCEYIWIELETAQGEQLTGTLANDPFDLPGFKLGSKVTVPLSELNDWMYIQGGEPQGGFTTKVLISQEEESSKSS